jgi:hypothetical protein
MNCKARELPFSVRPAHFRSMSAHKSILAMLLLSGLLISGLAAATTPHTFSAKYQVLRKGSPIGETTLTLRANADNTWTYASHMRATSGLAGMLGARVDETSHFRWRGNAPEALSYDYSLHASIKSKQRHVQVNWAQHQVQVQTDDGHYSYATQPGIVERHSMPLALGYALAAGKRKITLPVAVKDRVQMQSYAVTATEPVTVPAGHFEAERVDRTDDSKDFSAWYVPDRYPVPVKLTQTSGGHLTLLLKSFRHD